MRNLNLPPCFGAVFVPGFVRGREAESWFTEQVSEEPDSPLGRFYHPMETGLTPAPLKVVKDLKD